MLAEEQIFLRQVALQKHLEIHREPRRMTNQQSGQELQEVESSKYTTTRLKIKVGQLLRMLLIRGNYITIQHNSQVRCDHGAQRRDNYAV